MVIGDVTIGDGNTTGHSEAASRTTASPRVTQPIFTPGNPLRQLLPSASTSVAERPSEPAV